MFFCKPCKVKRKWPESLSTSRGRCEICGNSAVCYDVPSKFLPPPPKPPQTWKLPAEPGPEVTHVRDRYKLVWHRGEDGKWRYGDAEIVSWDWRTLFTRKEPLTDVSAEYSIDNDNPAGLAW